MNNGRKIEWLKIDNLKIKDKIFEKIKLRDLNLDYPIDKTSISIELQFLKNIKT